MATVAYDEDSQYANNVHLNIIGIKLFFHDLMTINDMAGR